MTQVARSAMRQDPNKPWVIGRQAAAAPCNGSIEPLIHLNISQCAAASDGCAQNQHEDPGIELNKRLEIIIAFILLILIAAAFSQGLAGGFLFDDYANIVENAHIHIKSLDFDAFRQVLSSPDAGPLGRPISLISFALNYYFSGLDPHAFKAVNLAIHLGNSFLVMFLGYRLTAPFTQNMTHAYWMGLWVAAAWAIHPIQSLVVFHAVQRMTSLSALFLLAALSVHIWSRSPDRDTRWPGLLIAWGVLWPLSMLSKESGALFPLFVFIWEGILRRQQAGHLDVFAKLYLATVALALAGAMAYLLSQSGDWLWAGYRAREFTPLERILTEARVLWTYIAMIILPNIESLGLYHDDIALSKGLFDPWTTFTSLAGLAIALWIIVLTISKAPLVAFGLAWFLIGHLLESTILPLELMHEHRNYVPLLGLLIAAVGGYLIFSKSRPSQDRLFLLPAIAVLVYLGFVQTLRAHQFGDDVRRTQIEAQHHRQSPRAQHDAGNIMASLPDATIENSRPYIWAQMHFSRATELDPSFKMSLVGLIYLECGASGSTRPIHIAELEHRLASTPFGPGDSTSLYLIKEIAIRGPCLKRTDVERIFFSTFSNSSLTPFHLAMAHSWLADYYVLGARDYTEGWSHLRKSLEIVPFNASTQLKLAQLAYLMDKPESQMLLDKVVKERLNEEELHTFAFLQRCTTHPGYSECKKPIHP